jgi:hypothetical protein
MSDKSFTHVLVTRFNSPIGDGQPPASDEWLRARLELFRKYALPSIKGQTVKPDRWLLLCHVDSPSWFKSELGDLVEGIGEPVWMYRGPSGPVLSELCSPVSTPHLITTRMDNDDSVARDYIEAIQEEFRGQQMEAINFTNGLQLRDGKLYNRIDPSNAFISVIENAEGRRPATVFMETHDRLDRLAPVVQVKTHPMWVQVVHDSNIANTVRGIRTTGRPLRQHFDLDTYVKEIGPLTLTFSRLATSAVLVLSVLANPKRIKKLARLVFSR